MNPKDFKILLIKKDTTITNLAKEIGVRREYLSCVIHGHRKGENIWPKIVKVLDIELQELS